MSRVSSAVRRCLSSASPTTSACCAGDPPLMTSTLSHRHRDEHLRIVALAAPPLSRNGAVHFVTPSTIAATAGRIPLRSGPESAGVLDRVVKQGRGGTDCVQPEIGDDGGNGDWMVMYGSPES